MKRLIPLGFFALVFVACNQKASDNATMAAEVPEKKETVDYKALIDETNKQFTAAALKGDSAAVVALFHPDARVLAPFRETMNAEQMGSKMAGFPKAGITYFDLQVKRGVRR